MAACVAFSLAGFSLLAAEKKSFDIPAGTADKALKAFTAQSGSEVVYPAEIARGVKTNAVKGEFTAQEALQKIVAGSDLTIALDEKTGALTVSRVTDPNAPRAALDASVRPSQNNSGDRLARSAAGDEPITLSAIQVSATRRLEPLQGVPLAVSVVDGDRASAENINNLRDLSSIVPSLNFRTTASAKDQALFLRGMGTVSTSPGIEPTVSTVVDGVPYARQGQANMDMLDVDHIEKMDEN